MSAASSVVAGARPRCSLGLAVRQSIVAAVADHDVVAVAGVDRVAVDPAEDDVVCRSRS